ncbi:MAG TPA: efflux RND transporter periplasmic adaptor subunit [Novosphingobium sp.]
MNEGRGWTGMAIGLLAGIGLGALGYHELGRPDEDDRAAAVAPAGSVDGVQLTDQQRAAAGLRVAALAPGEGGGEITGFARAVDPAPLAGIAADIATAEAASATSAREVARLTALVQGDAGASQRELEAAKAQAVADRAKLTQACQRPGLEFGAGLDRLGCHAIGELARAAATGQAALLRIDVPGQVLTAGQSVTVDLAPGSARLTLLGPASAGDSQLQTAGMLALLRGPTAARAGAGRVLQATVPGGQIRVGVLIPREAIVRVDGGLFVWRPRGQDRFERVAIPGAVATEHGWVAPVGTLRPGEPVVVSGAGTLLGLEHAAPPAAGDD